MGLPLINDKTRYDNGLYYSFDEQPNSKDYPIVFYKDEILKYDPIFYSIAESNYGEIKLTTWISGNFYQIISHGIEVDFLKRADHIEFFKNSKGEEDMLAWLYRRIVIDAHAYTLVNGNIIRTTINGNEEITLDTHCSNMAYQKGFMYYLTTSEKTNERTLSRIKLEGTEKEKVSHTKCSDYCLVENGAIYLTKGYNDITIVKEEFGENATTTTLGTFKQEWGNDYRVIGIVDDKLYLSIRYPPISDEPSKIEIYYLEDGQLIQVHSAENASNTSNFKPFIQGEYVFYSTKEGIYMFEPEKKGLVLTAKSFFEIPYMVSDSFK